MFILYYSADHGRRGDALTAALIGAAAHAALTGEPSGVRHVRTPERAGNAIPGHAVARIAARRGVAYDITNRVFVRARLFKRIVMGTRLACWRAWTYRPGWASRQALHALQRFEERRLAE